MKSYLVQMMFFTGLILLSAGCGGSSVIKNSGGPGDVQVIQTSQGGDHLAVKGYLNLTGEGIYFGPAVVVDTNKTYQSIVGFGGAFTESAAYVLSQLSPEKRKEALNAYFSTNGSSYTLTRTHIGSCDFSLSSYSYDDTSNDLELKNFSIDHDKKLLIPLIKDAMAIPGASFKILASPWSPPGWMKNTGKMVARYGHLKRECYDVYAKYLSKYVQSYTKEGIDIWAMTVQNESWNDNGQWEACQFNPMEQGDFVASSMGPRFEKDSIKTKIYIFDHNKGFDDQTQKGAVQSYVEGVMANKKAAGYVYGVACHWYGGDHFEDLDNTHTDFSKLHYLATEACGEHGTHTNDFTLAERYGHDIIGDLNNWAEGWIDWNLYLDENGGPNHALNYCSSLIMADLSNKTLFYNPSYYYLAHFSKYIRPGAVRLGIQSDSPDLEATAFRNTDNSIVVVVLNQTDLVYDFKLKVGSKVVYPKIPEHAMINFVIK